MDSLFNFLYELRKIYSDAGCLSVYSYGTPNGIAITFTVGEVQITDILNLEDIMQASSVKIFVKDRLAILLEDQRTHLDAILDNLVNRG